MKDDTNIVTVLAKRKSELNERELETAFSLASVPFGSPHQGRDDCSHVLEVQAMKRRLVELEQENLALRKGSETEAYALSLTNAPNPCIVYQRIVKPFPTVTVSNNLQNNGEYFIDVDFLDNKNEEITEFLGGTKRMSLQGRLGSVTFRKLKVLVTSQQRGSLLRLRFTLKQVSAAGSVPLASVTSLPIEVVSHTQYLKKEEEEAASVNTRPAPQVEHVVPSAAKPDSPIAIVGSGLQGCQVYFNDVEAVPVFQNASAIVVNVPGALCGQGIPLRVAAANVDGPVSVVRTFYVL